MLGLGLEHNNIQSNDTLHNNTECRNEPFMLSVIILTVLPSWEHVLALDWEHNIIQNNDTQHNNTDCCNEPIMLSVIILTELLS